MTTTTSLSELTGDYVLDTAHTRIGFVARHTMATKVRGQFGEFEGSAHLDGDDPPKLSAQLTITAKSIQTRNQHRDEALRSKFLDFKLTGAKTDPWGNFRVGFEGSATINRKDWGVHWNAAPGVVSKKVTLEFDVAAIRQS